MNRLAAVALLACAGCATQPVPVAPSPVAAPAIAGANRVPLLNPGFEEAMPEQANCAPGWGCKAHNGVAAFHFFIDDKRAASGARSFCVERVGHEPWAAVTQAAADIIPLRGKRVRFSGSFRVEGVRGDGGGAFILTQGGSGQTLNHAKRQEDGTQYWKRLQVELLVPREAFVLEVGLLLEGTGMACMDDVALEVIPDK